MRHGHLEAQLMFEEIGRSLGFDARRTYSEILPTDGVWFLRSSLGAAVTGCLPVVAIEVIVSEGPKAIQGDITILERVSPALAVILLHEDEIRRRMLSKEAATDMVEREVTRMRQLVEELIHGSRQRLQLWSAENLRRVYQLHTGKPSLYTHTHSMRQTRKR